MTFATGSSTGTDPRWSGRCSGRVFAPPVWRVWPLFAFAQASWSRALGMHGRGTGLVGVIQMPAPDGLDDERTAAWLRCVRLGTSASLAVLALGLLADAIGTFAPESRRLLGFCAVAAVAAIAGRGVRLRWTLLVAPVAVFAALQTREAGYWCAAAAASRRTC